MRGAILIFVIITCALAWKYFSSGSNQKMLRITIVGIIIAGVTTAVAASLPVTEISTGSNQELRVMPPAAFPFTIQQYRDYDTNQFNYRIVIGWPDGIPIYESVTMDDQSEFIHLAHLSAGLLLGIYQLVGLAALLIVIYLFDRRRLNTEITQPSASS